MIHLLNTFRLSVPRLALFAVVLLFIATTVSGVGPHIASAAPEVQQIGLHLPLVLNHNCLGGATDNPFAVQIYGTTDVGSNNFTALVDSGAKWIRNQVNWSRVEPTNLTAAQYRWGTVDHIVSAVSGSCYNMILTHAINPTWAATSPTGPINKVGIEEFTQFIGALVERYDGDGNADAPGSPVVNYFEFYNEPDGGPRPSGEAWGEFGTEYAQMLQAVYPVVKAANPNAQVVFGGIAYDGFTENGGVFVHSFLDDVLNAGAGPFFDVMNFHQYPVFAGSWTNGGKGPGLIEKTQAIRQKLAEHGLTKPIIITETGWWNNNAPAYPSNDEMQSRFVVALFVQGLAADVKINTWWPLIDIEGYQFAAGLFTADSPPQEKIALSVFKRMTQMLSSAQFNRTLPASETGNADIEVHEFTDTTAGQKLYVTWLDPVNQPDTPAQPLHLPANQVTVVDMFGATTTVTDGADGSTDGQVTLSVTRPIYVRVTG